MKFYGFTEESDSISSIDSEEVSHTIENGKVYIDGPGDWFLKYSEAKKALMTEYQERISNDRFFLKMLRQSQKSDVDEIDADGLYGNMF